jgi:transposase
MKKKHFFGIDVSKETLDVVHQATSGYLRITNNADGFEKLLAWFKSLKATKDNSWIVFEYTGIYAQALLDFCEANSFTYTQIPGLVIKLSSGIKRGKSDKIDAKAIADFAYEKRNTLKVNEPQDKVIERFKTLMNLRDKMVIERAGYKGLIKEMTTVLKLEDANVIISSQKAMVAALSTQIIAIEQEVKDMLEANPNMQKNYELLISIKGVGFVLAMYTIICTVNFTKFVNARKFATYCGTAPFDNSSGKQKPRFHINNLANKKMKSLLDQSARSAIVWDKEIKDYYIRRTEGKSSKMSAINIVRNKIIYRMFAIVKRQTPYQVDFKRAA